MPPFRDSWMCCGADSPAIVAIRAVAARHPAGETANRACPLRWSRRREQTMPHLTRLAICQSVVFRDPASARTAPWPRRRRGALAGGHATRTRRRRGARLLTPGRADRAWARGRVNGVVRRAVLIRLQRRTQRSRSMPQRVRPDSRRVPTRMAPTPALPSRRRGEHRMRFCVPCSWPICRNRRHRGIQQASNGERGQARHPAMHRGSRITPHQRGRERRTLARFHSGRFAELRPQPTRFSRDPALGRLRRLRAPGTTLHDRADSSPRLRPRKRCARLCAVGAKVRGACSGNALNVSGAVRSRRATRIRPAPRDRVCHREPHLVLPCLARRRRPLLGGRAPSREDPAPVLPTLARGEPLPVLSAVSESASVRVDASSAASAQARGAGLTTGGTDRGQARRAPTRYRAIVGPSAELDQPPPPDCWPPPRPGAGPRAHRRAQPSVAPERPAMNRDQKMLPSRTLRRIRSEAPVELQRRAGQDGDENADAHGGPDSQICTPALRGRQPRRGPRQNDLPVCPSVSPHPLHFIRRS